MSTQQEPNNLEKWCFIIIDAYGLVLKKEIITSMEWCTAQCMDTKNSKRWVWIIYLFFNLTNSLFFNLTIFIFFKTFSFFYFHFFLELESWAISMMLFDNEERMLSRPENPRPLTDKDRDRRNRLLHALGNQLTRYLALIKAEDTKIKNNVARENPITINWEKMSKLYPCKSS